MTIPNSTLAAKITDLDKVELDIVINEPSEELMNIHSSKEQLLTLENSRSKTKLLEIGE